MARCEGENDHGDSLLPVAGVNPIGDYPSDPTFGNVMVYECTPTLPCIVSTLDIIQYATIGIKEILRG